MVDRPSSPFLGVRPLWCLVTDRRRLSSTGGDDGRAALVALVSAAARAGVPRIQIRERDLEAAALGDLVRACVRAVAGLEACVLVNDRIDVALACGAGGVHLPSDAPPAARVRTIAPPGFRIGRSVHGAAEAALVAAAGGVDYLIAGTVLPTVSKAGLDRPLGYPGLEAVARAADVPVLGIGGMTPAAAPAVARAGAAGMAAIGLFAGLGPEVADLSRMLDESRRAFDSVGRLP
jgi:thiamine-phosphate pyrophosphorylase